MNYLYLAVAFLLVVASYSQSFAGIDFNHDNHWDFSEMKMLFDHYDTNGNGEVTVAEIMKLNNLTKVQVQVAISSYDANKDDKIDLPEVHKMFQKFDYDGDTMVTLAEFNRHVKDTHAVVGK